MNGKIKDTDHIIKARCMILKKTLGDYDKKMLTRLTKKCYEMIIRPTMLSSTDC